MEVHVYNVHHLIEWFRQHRRASSGQNAWPEEIDPIRREGKMKIETETEFLAELEASEIYQNILKLIENNHPEQTWLGT